MKVGVYNDAISHWLEVEVPHNTLNRKSARAARDKAYGADSLVTVTVTDGKEFYRVTRKGVEKL